MGILTPYWVQPVSQWERKYIILFVPNNEFYLKIISIRYPVRNRKIDEVYFFRLILGNYLIRHAHEEQQISAAMLVCTPFDVFKATESIEQTGLNLLLNKHLASNLKKTVER